MSPRRIIFLAVALLASFATIFLGKAWLGADRPPAPVQAAAEEKPTVRVLVARTDLPVGKILHHSEHLVWQTWPEDNLSPSYIVEGKKNIEDFDGFAVRSSLIAGEPITDARVVSPRDRGFLAAVISPGNRAVTVTLTPASGNAGFIFPDDRVDVLATLTLTEEDKGDGKGTPLPHHVTETVLTDIRVLAIDQRADNDNREVAVAKTATLEVTKKQAEILSVVGEIGRVSLSLHSLPLKDDQLAMDEERQGRTFTFDSEATGLIKPPNSSNSARVVVVRGADAKAVDFIRSTPVGGGGRQPPRNADEDR